MTLYVMLHAVFGIVVGMMLVYIRRAATVNKRKAWVVYTVGILFSFGLAATIGEFSVKGKVEEVYDWISAGVFLVAFVAVLVIFKKTAKE